MLLDSTAVVHDTGTMLCKDDTSASNLAILDPRKLQAMPHGDLYTDHLSAYVCIGPIQLITVRSVCTNTAHNAYIEAAIILLIILIKFVY